MDKSSGILLTTNFTNILHVNGLLAWFAKDYNASTGHYWQVIPDDSGVYEQVGEIVLASSTEAVGVSGMILWKFQAVRSGIGAVAFELYAPGGTTPIERLVANIEVK
jgi:predicted secreted protein